MRRLFEWIAHRRNDNKVFIPVLIGSSVTAGVVSLWIGLRQSVWFDEAYSILIAKQPIGDLLHLVSLDTHPPLYYIILKAWAGVFGWSELSLRSLSIMALMAALIVAGLLLRKMFGARVAIGGALLLMIAPMLLRYGFEIRMYSLGMLIGVSATYTLYSAWKAEYQKERNRWLAVYGLLVVIGMFTLYPLALLWLSHVTWILYVHKGKNIWKKLLPYILSYIGAVILFLPWLSTFIGQLSNGALAPIGQPMNLENIIGIITFNSIYSPTWNTSVLLTGAVIVLIGAVGYLTVQAKKTLAKHRIEITLLSAYIVVPVIVLMVVSLVSSMYVERYLVHVAIGLIMLVGAVAIVGFIHGKGRLRFMAAGVVYAVFLIGCVNISLLGNYNFQRMQLPTIHEAATAISGYCDSDKLILAADPYVATEFSYYLPNNCTMHFVSQWDTLGGGYAPFSGSDKQVKSTSSLSEKSVLYVFYGNPDQSMPQNYRETSKQIFGPLTVAEYTQK